MLGFTKTTCSSLNLFIYDRYAVYFDLQYTHSAFVFLISEHGICSINAPIKAQPTDSLISSSDRAAQPRFLAVYA